MYFLPINCRPLDTQQALRLSRGLELLKYICIAIPAFENRVNGYVGLIMDPLFRGVLGDCSNTSDVLLLSSVAESVGEMDVRLLFKSARITS